jgi:hypothetical protein
VQLTPYSEVNAVLNDFRVRLSAILGNHFQGMYVVGSLALGDFDPKHSDIDFVVVTDIHIDDEVFHKLQTMQSDFADSDSSCATKIEAVYIPQNALRSPVTTSEQYPQLEKGTAFFKAPLEDGWVFQLYTLREYALIVAGSDLRTLIDPIDAQAMRPAVAVIAGQWLKQAHHDPEWLMWVRQRGNQVFVIQTLCRMLYSLSTGDVASKPCAAQWGQTELEKWSTLIADSLARQYENEEIAQSELDDTIAFIQYTVEQSQV